MLRFRRVNRQYVVNYNNIEYVFAHHKLAWAFIFETRKDFIK